MADVVIYTKNYCPYCRDAKELLQKKGLSFTEYDLMTEPQRRNEMIAKAGGRTTVPQIFINGQHLGGCDDIYALERQGKLDAIIRGAA